jgi:hypothetical protein
MLHGAGEQEQLQCTARIPHTATLPSCGATSRNFKRRRRTVKNSTWIKGLAANFNNDTICRYMYQYNRFLRPNIFNNTLTIKLVMRHLI